MLYYIAEPRRTVRRITLKNVLVVTSRLPRIAGSLEEYYDKDMVKLLPFVFLVAACSLFGLAWMLTMVDPQKAAWYMLALFVVLIFVFVFSFLGLILYFVRTKIHGRMHLDSNWYARTSLKMAFFVALFISVLTILGMLQLITVFNMALAAIAIGIFMFWAYLGKR